VDRSAPISIKGIREGLLVTAGDGPWDEIEAALIDTIQTQREFFRGARLALQVGDRSLDKDEIRKLRDKLAEHDATLWAVLGQSPETIRSARRNDLETELSAQASTADAPTDLDDMSSDGELPPIDSNEYGMSAVLLKNTLRSGRVIRHVGHVIIIGDVNPGAQIIAGGDVIIWGRLRGTVHAGANGDPKALVCALDMRPQQLRIANLVAISPPDNHPRPRPEIAFVREGQIIAEDWGS
jgi:septum site-determining protein MinC